MAVYVLLTIWQYENVPSAIPFPPYAIHRMQIAFHEFLNEPLTIQFMSQYCVRLREIIMTLICQVKPFRIRKCISIIT